MATKTFRSTVLPANIVAVDSLIFGTCIASDGNGMGIGDDFTVAKETSESGRVAFAGAAEEARHRHLPAGSSAGPLPH